MYPLGTPMWDYQFVISTNLASKQTTHNEVFFLHATFWRNQEPPFYKLNHPVPQYHTKALTLILQPFSVTFTQYNPKLLNLAWDFLLWPQVYKSKRHREVSTAVPDVGSKQDTTSSSTTTNTTTTTSSTTNTTTAAITTTTTSSNGNPDGSTSTENSLNDSGTFLPPIL